MIDADLGPDAPIEINEAGGSQSRLDLRFDLVDGPAMFALAKVLSYGAEKYGADNWRNIPARDHLNHALTHAYAWLAGDRQDQHLEHFLCRAMFAVAMEITERNDPE